MARENYWIGFSDTAREGRWVWDSEAPAKFTNWYRGEPNNAGDEDGCELVVNWQGKWNDTSVGSKIHGCIVELD